MKKNIICLLMAIIILSSIVFSSKDVKASTDEESIELGINEDINEDGEVNILDLSLIATIYNTVKGDNTYDLKCDVNEDKIIDVYDLVRVSKKLGVITAKTGYVYNTGSTGLNVRSGPGTNYSKVGTLYDNDKVEIVNDSDVNWYKIKFNGGHAFVHKSYIDITNCNYKHSLDYYVDIQTNMLNQTDVDGSWRIATRDEVEYYMNPDNFKVGNGKYMFMKLTYVSGVSIDIAKEIIKEKGILDGKEQAFLTAAKKYNINPIYLMCHARLETGNGTSELSTGVLVDTIDGQPVEPKIVYNMFGIGAEDSGAVKLGAERAYKEGWFTPELAIIEGSYWLGQEYIHNSKFKQNTLYKMRWNIGHLGIEGHQYASDIAWAYKQATMMATYINKCNDIELEFDIPTFTPTLRELWYSMDR